MRTKIKAFVYLVSLFLMNSSVSAAQKENVKVQGPEQLAGSVDWKNFSKGLESAKKGKKYVFVDVYADWCGYCHQMEASTFVEPKVMQELKKNFVAVKFDSESQDMVKWDKQEMSQSELAGYWGVSSLPTLLFFSASGELIGSYPGYADAELFMKLLTYVSSGSREKGVPFDQYMEAL